MNLVFIDEGHRIRVTNGKWTEATYYEDESAYKHLKYYMELVKRLQEANPNTIITEINSGDN
jgi:hypothetical protein